MNGKQRAYLRKLANGLETKYQIGKDGVDAATIRMIDAALEAKELIKVKVLENSFLSVRDVCDEICAETGAYPVQCIGRRFIIYRESKENKEIELPR